jgi:hypothetical protein
LCCFVAVPALAKQTKAGNRSVLVFPNLATIVATQVWMNNNDIEAVNAMSCESLSSVQLRARSLKLGVVGALVEVAVGSSLRIARRKGRWTATALRCGRSSVESLQEQLGRIRTQTNPQLQFQPPSSAWLSTSLPLLPLLTSVKTECMVSYYWPLLELLQLSVRTPQSNGNC